MAKRNLLSQEQSENKEQQIPHEQVITEIKIEAEENKLAEITKKMVTKGLSLELIAEITGLTIDQIKALDADTTTTD